MMKPIGKPAPPTEHDSSSESPPSGRSGFWNHLTRNLALGGMLLLTIAAVHNAQWPSGQTVLAVLQEMVDPQWQEGLGKISFVSNMLPESVAVFFETAPDAQLTAPCLGSVTHVWSENEPYVGYFSSDLRVYAAGDGQVMSVAHGQNEERIVRVRHDNGLETLYYNLASVAVREGDSVTASTCLGRRISQEEALIEVRRAGLPIDPGALLTLRGEQP